MSRRGYGRGVIPAHLLEQFRGRRRHDPADRQVREAVFLRARETCEYCLYRLGASNFTIDHIIPESRWAEYGTGAFARLRLRQLRGPGGHLLDHPDHLANFAAACPVCNEQRKRAHIFGLVDGRPHRLFDPRRDVWRTHFGFHSRYHLICPKTNVGRATVSQLGLNSTDMPLPNRMSERISAIEANDYPPRWARHWLLYRGT